MFVLSPQQFSSNNSDIGITVQHAIVNLEFKILDPKLFWVSSYFYEFIMSFLIFEKWICSLKGLLGKEIMSILNTYHASIEFKNFISGFHMLQFFNV